jgi:hypothetical protein
MTDLTSKQTTLPFVIFIDNDKPVFINLNLIAMIRDFENEKVTLEMSSGSSVTIHGGEAIAMLLELLTPHSVTLSGEPFRLPEKTISENAPRV